MKINVGIVGFGNLGKALATTLKDNPAFNLVQIFSKRQLPGVDHVRNIKLYKDKIDLLFLCGGSKDELELQAQKYISDFSIVESYDNHSRLKSHITKLDACAKKSNKIALCSFGWDPGLFSFARGLFDSIGYTPFTFWGKGLSQGHTQAIKNIKGVIDGVQFTIPNKKIFSQINRNKITRQSKDFHIRKCYVVCGKKDGQKIKREIISMPDYFEGYKTYVKFISSRALERIKNFAHQGIVTTAKSIFEFRLKTKSNPILTAKIMCAFARAYTKLATEKSWGAFTIFDIPFNAILPKDKFDYL